MMVLVFWAIYCVVYTHSEQSVNDAILVVFAYVVPFLAKLYFITDATEELAAEVSSHIRDRVVVKKIIYLTI